MYDLNIIGKSVPRKESIDKVTGVAKYTNDYEATGLLYARMVTSPYAHAKIKAIEYENSLRTSGVRAVITGQYFPQLVGSTIVDRPPIAIDKVRYNGEPVAVVVADSEVEAEKAAHMIKVEYDPLPVVNSPSEAIKKDSPLVHEKLSDYEIIDEAFPEPNTNIANRTKIRKGNIKKGWHESEVTAEASFSFPPSDHAAMETRSVTARILPDGRVIIYSCSQAPFAIKKLISHFFNIDPGKVIVHVPLVGGAYGGKTAVQLEFIAYLCSKAVGGRQVKLTNTREEDFITSPVHIGLDAKIKLGSTKAGRLTAAEITYLFDGGSYSDRAVIISRAAGVDCTGPYNIENVWCDSLCMYTNHPYAAAFRGFGHPELTFAIERSMDILADKLGMDPLELRLRNAILPGDTSATQTFLDKSNLGNLPKCIQKLIELIHWGEVDEAEIEDGKVRAKGVSCFWKNSNTALNAGGGAVITFNSDGSINLICAAVEIGQGTKTALAQILAEKMKMDVDQVHVTMEVNTKTNPDHWKTAASRTTLLIGRSALRAAEDAINQLCDIAAVVLGCSPVELEVGRGRVFLKDNSQIGIEISKIAFGYILPNGNSIGAQVIGRGSYAFNNLTTLDPKTGKGNPGPEWTVGAAAVEVEFDKKEYTYKIIKAACVIDAGKVINAGGARGQISGGMNLGLSFATREAFLFTNKGIIQNKQLRTYNIMRLGENPEYLVDFVETPHLDGPYGARGIGEYGVIGMPAALGNSLSCAAEVHLNQLPLIPEFIWKVKGGGH
ncbi:xanthine dehydrogenase family protein molybdopterin-binding subunit [Clostridium botulinum]|uniref:Xanthine dehydrogenase family protein molybdopterin-binding subunit n=1 Tax=Clostridium botulinum TaxID=1491 RepID=A0A846J2I6_CLOBO|nr:xanthine dehydrogenase family protein molybdopterin-binding subunit [Clostridium botulinum]ACA55783.1 xanthine dehydrogenase family protein, molybdopterin-binding subunit [Clostridium botulinum A3 str. Loch Maree]NFH64475.1 xanthine dehydrogenase family protein molybdopterin-binding subunit [Clostridium botulinum]NFJ08209.1 xanthine dehydrogenase family protein molybdopterin-binding subunit [Clostridium botulinum]NFK15975.1 xanthine dehydrogenase family protein molybdopterin-binding subunit 